VIKIFDIRKEAIFKGRKTENYLKKNDYARKNFPICLFPKFPFCLLQEILKNVNV